MFDDAGQLTARLSPNETRSFVYDDAGRRIQWVDATGTTDVSFDDVGRMTSIITPAGAVSYGFLDGQVGEVVSDFSRFDFFGFLRTN